MAERHTILGGKVHVYKRPNSSSWQCATYLAGRNRRTPTKEDGISKAKGFAEDWCLQSRGKLRDGQLKGSKARTVNKYRIHQLEERRVRIDPIVAGFCLDRPSRPAEAHSD